MEADHHFEEMTKRELGAGLAGDKDTTRGSETGGLWLQECLSNDRQTNRRRMKHKAIHCGGQFCRTGSLDRLRDEQNEKTGETFATKEPGQASELA